MPILDGRHDGRALIVDVLAAEPSHRRSWRTLAGQGLIDTGASASLISRRFAEDLGLVGIGARPLFTARGTELAERYAFRIGFLVPTADGVRRPFIIDEDLIGSEFDGGGRFDVIIGMDILRTGDLTLRRDRSFSFSF